MSDDYLWDRSGTPAPDELWLERVMPAVSHERSAKRPTASMRSVAARRPLPVTETLAVLAAVAAVVAVAFGIRTLVRERSVAVAPPAELRPEPGMASPEPGVASPVPTPVPRPLGPVPGGSPSAWQRGILGPVPPAPVSASPPPADEPLDAASIQRVVSAHTAEVRRKCWQRALVEHDGGPTTARVVLRLVIAPSGAVSSATTNGDPAGFPGLGSCVATSAKSWRFPASSHDTAVNVPFVFASQ